MKKIFVSYKSENANEVRTIVEFLAAKNYQPWFAEYEVLSSNYDEFEMRLNDELRNAVKSSQYALLFTNKKWDESEHCNYEYELVASHFSKTPNKVLQIHIPEEKRPFLDKKFLSQVKKIRYEYDNHAKVIQEILKHIEENNFDYLDQNIHSLVSNKFVFNFPFGSINVDRLERHLNPPNHNEVKRLHLYYFQGTLNSYKVNLEININPSKTLIRHQSLKSTNLPRNDIIIYSNKWYKQNGFYEKGLHLYFKDGLSHLGLTYCIINSQQRHRWHRLYSLILQDTPSNQLIQFDFDFSVNFDSSDTKGSFHEFCKLFHYFDLIMGSFEYKSHPSFKKLPSRIEKIAFKSVCFILALIPGYLFFKLSFHPWNIFLGILIGISSGWFGYSKIGNWFAYWQYVDSLIRYEKLDRE